MRTLAPLIVIGVLAGAIVPIGSAAAGNTYIEPDDLAVDVQSDLFKGAPAVVVLSFVATNGHHVKSVFGYSRKAVYYLKTCAASLPAQVPSLVAQAQTSREAVLAPTDRPPFSYKGLKFLGAECLPAPHRLGDLDGPNTTVEFSFFTPDFN